MTAWDAVQRDSQPCVAETPHVCPADYTTLTQQSIDTPEERAPALAVLSCPDRTVFDRVALLDDGTLRLGRHLRAPGFCFDDPHASRWHATITWARGAPRGAIRDRGSRNGTRLNGRKVDHAPLEIGDVVRLGDTLLTVVAFDMTTLGWKPPEGSLMKGRSAALKRLYERLDAAAASDVAVLLLGETGTGKELAARELHRRSGRRGRLVPVNCAALPEALAESELFGHRAGAFSGASGAHTGLIAAADGGTLFLDEVGELSATLQAKLLRVLDDKSVRPVGDIRARPVDVRVVAATNRDLPALAQRGQFREDLLARLDHWRIEVVPLRERVRDVMPIAEALLAAFNRERPSACVLSADTAEALTLYHWPRNVRELAAALRAATLATPAGGPIAPAALPAAIATAVTAIATAPRATPAGAAPSAREESMRDLLARYDGNIAAVARHLGRSRMQVYRWLEQLGVDADEFRGGR